MNPLELQRNFERDGFAFLPSRLPDDIVARLREAVDAIMAEADPGDPRFDFEPGAIDGRPVVQRIKKPHETIPFCAELARSPLLLDAVEALIGPDIRLHHSKINVKAPVVGSPLEWHQDWAFIPHSNQSLAFVAVFIDDVPQEKGPLQVLEGSHLDGLRDHHEDGVFYGAIDPATLPLERAVALTGPRGSVSIHHPLMVHGSGLNRSGEARRMLFLEYAAADAWPFTYGVDWDEFNRRIVRGAPCVSPRLEALTVRMPYPAPSGGAARIYAQQRLYAKRYFTTES